MVRDGGDVGVSTVVMAAVVVDCGWLALPKSSLAVGVASDFEPLLEFTPNSCCRSVLVGLSTGMGVFDWAVVESWLSQDPSRIVMGWLIESCVRLPVPERAIHFFISLSFGWPVHFSNG